MLLFFILENISLFNPSYPCIILKTSIWSPRILLISRVVNLIAEGAPHCHWIWLENGKRKIGVVYDVMRHTRHRYHYAVRAAKRFDMQLRRQRLA